MAKNEKKGKGVSGNKKDEFSPDQSPISPEQNGPTDDVTLDQKEEPKLKKRPRIKTKKVSFLEMLSNKRQARKARKL